MYSRCFFWLAFLFVQTYILPFCLAQQTLPPLPPKSLKLPQAVLVFDKTDGLVKWTRAVGAVPQSVSKSPLASALRQTKRTRLVIAVNGPFAAADTTAVRNFVSRGGRVVLIVQAATPKEIWGLEAQSVTVAHLTAVGSDMALLGGKVSDLAKSIADTPVFALRRPVSGGWIPLLLADDTEFSPFLSQEIGQGRLLICTLPLPQTPTNPVFVRFFAKMLEYANRPVAPPIAKSLYIGNANGRELLDRLGIVCQSSLRFQPDAGLIIVSPETRTGVTLLIEQEYLKRGGRVVVLPASTVLSATGKSKEAGMAHHAKFTGPKSLPRWPECRGIVRTDLVPSAPLTTDLLVGKDVAADGLLKRTVTGKGILLRVQIDPSATSDAATALRFDRALSTILANMGAKFLPVASVNTVIANPVATAAVPGQNIPMPKAIPPQVVLPRTVAIPTTANPPLAAVPRKGKKPPAAKITSISLTQTWRVKQTLHLPSGTDEKQDPGVSLDARILLKPYGYDGDWDTFDAPGDYPAFVNEDGEAIFRLTLTLPATWLGHNLEMSLGTLDDNDSTYFNGTLIGATNGKTTPRVYTVPKALVRRGRNVIAVRLFDSGGTGGFLGPANQMTLRVKPAIPVLRP